MSAVQRSIMRLVTATMVRRYQRSGGRKSASARGIPILLLTVRGRRTGAAHTVPVCFIERDGELLVMASAGGAKQKPQWIKNLRAAGRAEVQIGERRFSVDASIPTGSEHAKSWDHVVEQAPFFAAYERKARRTIPVAVLHPAPGERPGREELTHVQPQR